MYLADTLSRAALQNSGGSRPSDRGRPGHPDPEIGAGAGLKKNKGGWTPQAPPLDPPLQKPTPSGPQEEIFQCCLEDNDELFRTELDSPEMLLSTIEEIRVAKKADPSLSVLCEFVDQGWPLDKSCVPLNSSPTVLPVAG